MKPTSPITPNQGDQRNFPLTDYQFKTTAGLTETSTAVARRMRSAHDLRTFRQMSSDFFASETRGDYIKELLLFTLIVAISAWPIFLSIVAITRLVRNY